MMRAIRNGIGAVAALSAINGGIILLVSDGAELRSQLKTFWPYIALIMMLFGFQVGLWTRLRERLRRPGSATGAVVASGASGTVAMIACCSHYLASLVPLVAISGALAALARFQPFLYAFGVLVNLGGIAVVSRRLWQLKAHAP